MNAPLSDQEISSRLESLEGWSRDGKEIFRQFAFRDFVGAMAFVNAVALRAEAANHHPDIDIRWNKVLLRLSTHSAGGLTGADFDLAAKINGLG
jgi:4a-hydroxytetrahydrobiopterin dehydratase